MEQLNWVSPSICGSGNNCPEVAVTADAVYIRSNLTPDAPAARLTHQEWRDLLDGAAKGEFDV